MIAITTSSSISVNPDERLGSLRIVCMDSLLENPHLFERPQVPGGQDVFESKTRRAYTRRGIRSTLVLVWC
jgi:hypothetical protein